MVGLNWTSFDYTTLRQRRDDPPHQYHMRIIALLNTWLKPFTEQLIHGLDFDRSPQSVLYLNTHIHKTITIYKMCVLMGFRWSWISVDSGKMNHTIESLHTEYVNQTNKYQHILRNGDRSFEYSMNKRNDMFDHYNMFAGWCMGAKWGSLSMSWG